MSLYGSVNPPDAGTSAAPVVTWGGTFDFHRLDQITGGTTIRTLGTVQRLAKKYF